MFILNQQHGVNGDLWLNSLTNPLYFYDGTDSTFSRTLYTAQQGNPGFETVLALDTQNNSKTTVRFFIGGTLVGVFANEEFTPVGYTVSGITGNIQKGFNLIDGVNFVYRGTADLVLH